MVYKVNASVYIMAGFEEYLDEFEMFALPEFKGIAEELFLMALETEPQEGDILKVRLEAEKTKRKENLVFPFQCCNPEYRNGFELDFLGYRVEE